MMKLLLHIGIVALVFLSSQLHAQAPQGINYQGVARGLDGQPIANKYISIRISVLNESSSGPVEYEEVHEVKTNSFGLFTLVIGQGSQGTTDFSFIGWTTGPKWLQIEMDENGGSSFKLMGSQQLMSVPYALYAERSGNGYQAGQGISISNNMISNAGDGDNDPNNELINEVTLGTDNKLRITDAGGTKETDLSGLLGASQDLSNVLVEGNSAGNLTITNLGAPTGPSDAATKAYVDAHADGDASATNELQDLSQVLARGKDAGGLKIENVGTPTSSSDAATKAYVDAHVDGDASTTNEIQNLSQVLAEGNNAGGLKITNIGSPTLNADATTKAYVDNLDALDGDKSASNEIQDLSLISNTLKITNNTIATSIDLSPYLDNTDNQNLINVLSNGNSAGGSKISNVGVPTLGTDAATKSYVDAHTDGDASPTNELQNLSSSSSGINRTINISGGTSTTIDVADNDNSSTNEIQNLTNTVSGTNRTINISGGTGTTIDVADNDNSSTNEAQSISRVGSTVTMTPVGVTGGGSFSVNDNDADPANEIQNLGQVLTIGNDAGAKKIINLIDPTNAQDAATKKYVDDADAVLSSKISTTYAFKASYNFTHTAPTSQIVTLLTDFDDFSVIALNRFTAPENGIYQFTVSGACNVTSIQMQIRVTPIAGPTQFYTIKRQTGYPDASTLNYFDGTILKLSVGDQVDLIATSTLTGEIITGSFFGFKL